MREIIFRGKRIVIGKWVYGYLFILQPGRCFIFDDKGKQHEVVEDTVGQYSGVKDKFGTAIYEHDIVLMNAGHKTRESSYALKETANIFFEDGMFTHGWVEPYLDGGSVIVLGNAHDNPEMMRKDG